jgi:hypothetical protein
VATFDFIASDEFRACLERDAEELPACMKAGAWKAAHVMAGSLIQATLIDYLTSCGKATEDELLRLSFSELLEFSRNEQVLSPRTADLASFIRPYADFLNPSSRTRLRAATDETGARIAQALLEIIINEVSAHKGDTYRYTAEQVVAKLQSDPSSVAIIGHLLRKISRLELERLLIELLPKTYFELAKQGEPQAAQTLRHFEQCFRVAFELAPVDSKRAIARQFVSILENESEYVVQCYESCFFRGSDLEYLDEEERGIVKTHFFASLSKQITPALANAAAGMGAFLASEQDTRAFFVPLVLGLTDERDGGLTAAIVKRISEEHKLLSEQNRRSIASWIGRLRWSLEKEGRRSGVAAIALLDSALAAQ